MLQCYTLSKRCNSVGFSLNCPKIVTYTFMPAAQTSLVRYAAIVCLPSMLKCTGHYAHS